MNSEPLITLKEASEELRISRAALKTLELDGELVPIRLGRRIFYTREQLDRIKMPPEPTKFLEPRRPYRRRPYRHTPVDE